MGRFRQIFVVAVLLVACSQNQASGNPSAAPSPAASSSAASADIGYMRMTSPEVVWAGTSKGTLRSTDRGGHWTDISPRGAQAGDLFALDDQTAWVTIAAGDGTGFTMYRTTDGGQRWTAAAGTLPRGRIGRVMFVDKLHGWSTVGLGAAAGSEAVAVLRTDDAGASWRQVAESDDPTSSVGRSGISFGCDKGTAEFGTPSVGLLAQFCAGGPPSIYRTIDGGSRWTSVNLPYLSEQSSFGDPVFLTPTEVQMVGNYGPSPSLLVSHDAGLTWKAISLPSAGALSFDSPQTGWQLGTPIKETTDGGFTWHALPAPAPKFKVADMALQYFGRGVALVWSINAAYRTDDGGASWKEVTPLR